MKKNDTHKIIKRAILLKAAFKKPIVTFKWMLIVLFLFITPRVFAQIVPYTADANTVLLDHFDGATGASILAYSGEQVTSCTQQPSATPSYSYISGPNGFTQALILNPPVGQPAGSATYLQYPNGQILSVPNGSIEFYVYLTSYGNGLGRFVSQGQYYWSCGGWTFDISVDSTGHVSSTAWAAFINMNSGTSVIKLNTWTHVAVTWGSAGAKLYINGALVGSDANTGMPASGFGGSLLMTLGTYSGAAAWIDELRVSNIQRTYTPFNTAPATPQNLIATAGNGQVTLKWNKNTEADFLKYKIYEGKTSGSKTLVDSSSALITDTTRTLSGLTNGTTYYFCITAVNSTGMESGFSNEVNATPIVALLPTITSFTPTSGPIGTIVTITGTNFAPVAGSNIVYFGAVKATVTAVTSTSISVMVPVGATYQPITVTVNGLTSSISIGLNSKAG